MPTAAPATAAEASSSRLKWRSGTAGCAGLIGIAGAAMFFWWALRPDRADLDGHGRKEALVWLSAQLIGPTWTSFLLAVACGSVAVAMGWRFAKPVAIQAGSKGLTLYRLTGDLFVPWDQIEYVQLAGRQVVLIVRFKEPQLDATGIRRRKIQRLAGVDLGNGEGERFISTARHLQERASGR